MSILSEAIRKDRGDGDDPGAAGRAARPSPVSSVLAATLREEAEGPAGVDPFAPLAPAPGFELRRPPSNLGDPRRPGPLGTAAFVLAVAAMALGAGLYIGGRSGRAGDPAGSTSLPSAAVSVAENIENPATEAAAVPESTPGSEVASGEPALEEPPAPSATSYVLGAPAAPQATPVVVRLEVAVLPDERRATVRSAPDPAWSDAVEIEYEDEYAPIEIEEPPPPPRDMPKPRSAPKEARPSAPALSADSVEAVRERYRLEGVFWSDNDPMALINGEILRAGSSFDGMRVVEIGKTEVSIEIGGKRYLLQ